MVDKSGDGLDKRNWRDRLGIGKNAGVPDMPKFSIEDEESDVKPVRRAPPRAAAPVAPAPMAPRSGGAPMAPRAAGPRMPSGQPVQGRPVTAAPRPMPAAPAPTVSRSAPAPQRAPVPAPQSNDALAQQLREQREAAERLAHQRIQSAMTKAENNLQASQITGKPKFSFAEDPLHAQPSAPRPPITAPTPQYAPQVQPTRAPLGGGSSFPPPPSFQQVGQQPAYPPAQTYQPGQYANPYAQAPNPYRPVEQPPVQHQYTPQAPSQYAPQQQPLNPPRKTMQPQQQQGLRPPMGQNPGQGASLAPPQRGPRLDMGPGVDDDIFETATPARMQRRATANDYQQAYRDELSYDDDEAPKSRGLGTLLGLALLMVLVAFGVGYGYMRFVKQTAAPSANAPVPVITAPATPTKADPEPVATPQTEQTGRKQIYDRIEGDNVVPGGTLNQTEEAPAQSTGQTNGAEGIAPPPQPVINDQQGALSPDPFAPEQTKIVSQIPAVEPSSTANSSQTEQVQPVASAGEKQNDQIAALSEAAAKETITDTPEVTVAPKPAPETPASKIASPAPVKKSEGLKALAPSKKKTENLGSEPVVLVPAKKQTNAQSGKVLVPAQQDGAGETDFYGDTAVTITPKKPKTIAASETEDFYGDAAGTQLVAPAKKPSLILPKTQPKPEQAEPVQQAALEPPPAKGIRVELASFSSKNEALAEYKKLSAKHGAIISNHAPLVVQKKVLGVTLYQLNLGPMASKGTASNVCASLFVAGERDCSVAQN